MEDTPASGSTAATPTPTEQEVLTDQGEVARRVLADPDCALTAAEIKSLDQTRSLSRETASWRLRYRDCEKRLAAMQEIARQWEAVGQTALGIVRALQETEHE